MHTAYINDKPIQFLDVYNPARIPEHAGWQILSEAKEPLEKVLRELEGRKEWTGVIYLSESPGVAWNRFASLFKLVPAAGGLVRNKNGEYLLIFRRGKWDLPKGKIDGGETPEEAALREVEEECGIGKLKLGKELPPTFHTYPENGKKILKKTHWYLMESGGDESLVPQTEEDIDLAVWMPAEEIPKRVYHNTYNSIRDLLETYFSSAAK